MAPSRRVRSLHHARLFRIRSSFTQRYPTSPSRRERRRVFRDRSTLLSLFISRAIFPATIAAKERALGNSLMRVISLLPPLSTLALCKSLTLHLSRPHEWGLLALPGNLSRISLVLHQRSKVDGTWFRLSTSISLFSGGSSLNLDYSTLSVVARCFECYCPPPPLLIPVASYIRSVLGVTRRSVSVTMALCC